MNIIDKDVWVTNGDLIHKAQEEKEQVELPWKSLKKTAVDYHDETLSDSPYSNEEWVL